MTAGGATAGTPDGEGIRAWLERVWSRTEAAIVLAGGDDGGPLARRRVLAEVYDDADLAELRALTTTGVFTGDVCRCHGHLTVALLDARGEFIGSGSRHGETDIAWERGRFRDNLEVADPEALEAFLRRHEVYGRPPDVT